MILQARMSVCQRKIWRGVVSFVVAVMSLVPAGMVNALTSAQLRVISQSNSFYYDPEGNCDKGAESVKICVTLANGTRKCSAGLLPGNTNEEKIWNYLVKADIDGISDNPEAIAGVIGNLKSESGLDPFAVSEGRYGLHAVQAEEFKAAVDDVGLGQYWGNAADVSAEEVGKAIEVELDWLVRNEPEWIGGCFEKSCWAEAWRKDAQDVYDGLVGSASAVPVDATANFTTTATYSAGGNIKYDMTDGEIEWLTKFAVWEAGRNDKMFQNVLSEILDDYEVNEGVKKGDSEGLIRYVKEGWKFMYRDDYDEYAALATDITLSTEQREAAKQVIVDGLRTTVGGKIEIESSGNAGDKCATNLKAAKGAARIAQVAVQMSWPVITPEYTEEQGHTGECAIDGRDSNTYNRWIEYNGRGSACDYTPRKLYRENYAGQVSANVFNAASGFTDRKYMDCSWFVGTVMRYLFGAEYGFPQGGPGYQMSFMEAKPDDWQVVPNHDSLDDLQPGDVLAYRTGGNHIMIYVGEYGGEYGEWSQASADDCVGLVETKGNSGWGHFTIYRYVGHALD